jgi:hypothetical protein
MSDQVSTVRQQQAPTVRLPKRLPLVQLLSNRDNTLLKDARLVNAYAEKQPDGGYRVRKRPCLAGLLSLGSRGQAYGFYYADSWLYAILLTSFEVATIWAINITTLQVYNLGNVDGTGLQYTFDDVSLGPTYATLVAGNGVKAYTLGGGTVPPTVAQITNANFPTSFCPGWATLDGTTYVMDTTGKIFGSAINDPTTWTALNFILANSDPDQPVGLAKHLTYVIAFKQWTTNVFYDAGNPPPGSPLSPVQGALIPYGCLAMSTVQEIDGQLFWMTTGSENVTPQIGNINQLSFSVVSTPQIDRLIQPGGSNNEFYSFTLKTAGHRFYGLTNYIQNYTILYDIDQQMWDIWCDYTATNFFPGVLMASQNLSAYTTNFIALDINSGFIYSVQPDYWVNVDAINYTGGKFVNAAPLVDIYTPSFDADTRRRKHLNLMFFNGDKVGGSTLQVRHNDDDYQTNKWSNFRIVNLNAVTPMLAKEGTFRRRAYNFRHQAATPFRLESVDLQLDLGTL